MIRKNFSGEKNLGAYGAGIFVGAAAIIFFGIFIVMPIVFSYGGVTMKYEGVTDGIKELLIQGSIGVILSFLVGLILICKCIISNIRPDRYINDDYREKHHYFGMYNICRELKDKEVFDTEMKLFNKRRFCIWASFIAIIAILICVSIFAISISSINSVCAGNIFAIIGALSIATIISGVMVLFKMGY